MEVNGLATEEDVTPVERHGQVGPEMEELQVAKPEKEEKHEKKGKKSQEAILTQPQEQQEEQTQGPLAEKQAPPVTEKPQEALLQSAEEEPPQQEVEVSQQPADAAPPPVSAEKPQDLQPLIPQQQAEVPVSPPHQVPISTAQATTPPADAVEQPEELPPQEPPQQQAQVVPQQQADTTTIQGTPPSEEVQKPQEPPQKEPPQQQVEVSPRQQTPTPQPVSAEKPQELPPMLPQQQAEVQVSPPQQTPNMTLTSLTTEQPQQLQAAPQQMPQQQAEVPPPSVVQPEWPIQQPPQEQILLVLETPQQAPPSIPQQQVGVPAKPPSVAVVHPELQTHSTEPTPPLRYSPLLIRDHPQPQVASAGYHTPVTTYSHPATAQPPQHPFLVTVAQQPELQHYLAEAQQFPSLQPSVFNILSAAAINPALTPVLELPNKSVVAVAPQEYQVSVELDSEEEQERKKEARKEKEEWEAEQLAMSHRLSKTINKNKAECCSSTCFCCLLIIVLVILAGGAYYYFYYYSKQAADDITRNGTLAIDKELAAEQDFWRNKVRGVNDAGGSWQAQYHPFALRMAPQQENDNEQMKSHKMDLFRQLKDNSEQHIRQLITDYVAGNETVPEEFDARNVWPNCWTIQSIGNHRDCRNSWAYAVTEMVSDRVCIEIAGQYQMSVEDLTTCCSLCNHYNDTSHSCDMGTIYGAVQHWKNSGIVTGSHDGTSEGCKPICTGPSCVSERKTGVCRRECQQLHGRTYEEDKIFAHHVYTLSKDICTGIADCSLPNLLQLEVQKSGPIALCFTVSEDLQIYKSGIFRAVNSENSYFQCGRLIGWGEEAKTRQKYWLMSNSRGRLWGENGFFQIGREVLENASVVEIVAGQPKFSDDGSRILELFV